MWKIYVLRNIVRVCREEIDGIKGHYIASGIESIEGRTGTFNPKKNHKDIIFKNRIEREKWLRLNTQLSSEIDKILSMFQDFNLD